MPITRNPLPPKQTLLLILLPMLATFICLRLYLHLMGVRHIYLGGHLIHHLFLGVVIEIPAAFILAFGPRHRLAALGAPVALGIGSALILDEVAYLALTNATDARLHFSRLPLRRYRLHLRSRAPARRSLLVPSRLTSARRGRAPNRKP
jgi:hypothetical protein